MALFRRRVRAQAMVQILIDEYGVAEEALVPAEADRLSTATLFTRWFIHSGGESIGL